jgi:hypothetical protein
MKLPRIPLSPGWTRLLDGLCGILAAVAAGYGLAMSAGGRVGPAGLAFDVGVGIGGLFGVLLTCFDMIEVMRWRARAASGTAFVGTLQKLLAVMLAGIAVWLAMISFLFTLEPELALTVRLGFAALSLFQVALALWLQTESRH